MNWTISLWPSPEESKSETLAIGNSKIDRQWLSSPKPLLLHSSHNDATHLGATDAEYQSLYREANKALWRLTLLPLVQTICEAIGQGLADWYPGAALDVAIDRMPALSEDRERLWSSVTAADFLTREEKRAMLGLTPEEETI